MQPPQDEAGKPPAAGAGQPTGEGSKPGPPWEPADWGPPPWALGGPWYHRRAEWEERRRHLREHRWQHRRPGWLFARFAGVFGLMALLVLGGLGLLIFLVVRLAGGDPHTAARLWLGTCALLLFVPGMLWMLGRRVFRSIARPLGNLLDAADRVAAGDLSARVPEQKGEFGQLTRSFNHMVEELALADRRRRNLTADVAHELRTPLQIIQGNLEGVLDGVYAPTPEHIEATLGETRVLARLVEDLRVLSQAEAGQLPMQWETVDVGELLEDVVTSFSGPAQVAGVTLRCTTVGDGRLAVRGDYGRLEQVLGNLTANALRHTPAGGSVVLAAEAAAGRVRISVTDTGEGIAAEDLPFVFDRFWRGDRARTHSSGGSGLGLAIARQLVQLHGGDITVESTLGSGTRFTIELGEADEREKT